MSPYIKYIRKKYIKMLGYLPFQLFLLFPRAEEEEKDHQIFNEFQKTLVDTEWCQNKFARQIFTKSREFICDFKAEYVVQKKSGNFTLTQTTFHFIEHFLASSEMEQFNRDFSAYTLRLENLTKESGVASPLDDDEPSVTELVAAFFQKFPSKTKPLTSYLSELPFQIFILVADADRKIDFEERSQFLRMLKDENWCESDCARDCFIAADYSFDELYRLFTRGKFKKDIKHVKRTISVAESLYTENEMLLLKKDMMKFARDIAKASGGIGSFSTVSREEKSILNKLDSVMGDLVEMQKRIKRKEDNSNDVLFSHIKSTKPNQANNQPSENFDFREQPRVQYPQIGVTVNADGLNFDTKVINISRNGILCEIEFKDNYVDLYLGANLSIVVITESNKFEMKELRCKTIRCETIFWTLEHIPNSVRIAWRFVEVSEEHQASLKQMMDDILSKSS